MNAIGVREVRALDTIARDIMNHWGTIPASAWSYLRPMMHLHSINDKYLFDTGRDIVNRFLCNAESWRGEHARRIKAELKAMLKEKK